ncbi:MAG TPA: pyridoxal-phosphate dependent enzyme [Rhodanobacteraceae bacterium]|jgi:threonine dehydratase|nr:pyridoxal-phosphate dependent enzyme [Rhodanobacteraceae bacterium]
MNSPSTSVLPDFAAVEAAAARIAAYAQRTPVRSSHSIDALAGAEILFKCENLQRIGAFKFRGACNAVWSLPSDVAARGVVTHSSGNHGAAVALAARTRGIPAHVVVPEGAVRTKVAAIEEYGATLHVCAPTMAAREAAAEELLAKTGGTLVHPFTTPDVIAGQGTAALELIRDVGQLDALVTPLGGGGLVSGSAIVAHELLPNIRVYGAEPEGAADAYESLRRGERVRELTPHTICDGLRGLIGAINFDLLRKYNVTVLPVADSDTIAAMRLVFERMKLVVEPSSAIALAAVLHHRELFAGRRVGVILSGGNVDLDALPW